MSPHTSRITVTVYVGALPEPFPFNIQGAVIPFLQVANQPSSTQDLECFFSGDAGPSGRDIDVTK